MWFKGWLNATEIDIEVAAANKSVMSWYGSKEELREDCGEDADITEIIIPDFEITLPDNYIMTFEDIGLN
jgi:hypothetical protein